MKKTKYTASVWVPNYTYPGTDKPAPVEFERIVDDNQPAPFYESDNYAAIIINMENGECRTYANMQYRLIVKKIKPLTWEEFNAGVKFKTELGTDGQIYSFGYIDKKPRIIVHRRDRALTPTNAIPVKMVGTSAPKAQESDYVLLDDENKTRLYFHEMYRYD